MSHDHTLYRARDSPARMYFSAQNRQGIFDFPPHNNRKLSSSSIHHLAGLCPVHLFCQLLGFAVPLQRQEAGWLPRRERLLRKCPGECTYGYVDLSSSLGRGQSLAAYLTRKPSAASFVSFEPGSEEWRGKCFSVFPDWLLSSSWCTDPGCHYKLTAQCFSFISNYIPGGDHSSHREDIC